MDDKIKEIQERLRRELTWERVNEILADQKAEEIGKMRAKVARDSARVDKAGEEE